MYSTAVPMASRDRQLWQLTEPQQQMTAYNPNLQSGSRSQRIYEKQKELALAPTRTADADANQFYRVVHTTRSTPPAAPYLPTTPHPPPSAPLSARSSSHLSSTMAPFRAPLLASSEFSRSCPLGPIRLRHESGQLYPTQTFRRSAELTPLPPTYTRDETLLPYVFGRANPRPFAVPPLEPMYAGAHSARCFPKRAQCPITKFKENLLRHYVETDF